MKDFIDFEGKSVEQAVERACQDLRVSKDQLSYDIISYGSTGIFGLVRTKKALIRVASPNSKPRAQETPQPESDREASDHALSGGSSAEEAQSAPDNLAGDNRSAINALLDETFGEMETEGAEEKEIAEASTQEALEQIEDVNGDTVEAAVQDQEEAETSAPASDEAIAVAREMLTRILAVLSPGADVSVHQDPDLCRMHINGGETAVLIGRKGQTLEAMQYLVDKAINKQCGKGFRIVVDVEGYLETRRSELKEAATRLAEKAQKSGKPTTMNRMNAHDRRIVHLALKNNKAVRTQSVGDGYYRKLMILPKRRKRGSKTGGRSRQSQ